MDHYDTKTNQSDMKIDDLLALNHFGQKAKNLKNIFFSKNFPIDSSSILSPFEVQNFTVCTKKMPENSLELCGKFDVVKIFWMMVDFFFAKLNFFFQKFYFFSDFI